MKLQRKVMTSMSIVAAMTLVTGGVGIATTVMVSSRNAMLGEETIPGLDALSRINSGLLEVTLVVHEELQPAESPSSAAERRDRYEASRDDLLEALEHYLVNAEDEEERELQEEIAVQAAAVFSATELVFEHSQAGRAEEAVRAGEAFQRANVEADRLLGKALAVEVEEVIEGGEFIDQVGSVVIVVEIAAAATAFGLAAFVGMRLARSLDRSISAIGTAAEEYGRGNLEASVTIPASDEFADLANRMQAMAARLAESRAALENATEEAETANRAKSDFLANMSHEIRTPMSAIMGFADLLADPNQSEEERRDFVLTIRRNGEHLLRVINDILDISRIEAGRVTVDRKECSICQIVADVAALMRVRAAEKGLELQVHYVFPVPAQVTTDPLRLRQILVNLVGNAVKFTEEGRVQIMVRADGIVDPVPTMAIEIVDTGIGMTSEQVERLFSPFSQVDTSPTRRFGGSGLGLAISRALARLLGGDLNVDTAHGRGSSFVVTFQIGDIQGVRMLRNASEAMLESVTDIEDQTERRLSGRILLAEDGPDNQRLITFLLRKAGADVTVADDGVEAVDAVTHAREQSKPFDLILMDMQMPEMDGYAATRKLRSMDVRTPIVALTAHAMTGDREKCIAAGCDDYVSKPVDRSKLLSTCAEWIAGGETSAA